MSKKRGLLLCSLVGADPAPLQPARVRTTAGAKIGAASTRTAAAASREQH